MGGGNGAKAQQKRERNAKNAGGKSNADPHGKTQNKIKCVGALKSGRPCFVELMSTQKADMARHVETEHSGSTVETCFPPKKP